MKKEYLIAIFLLTIQISSFSQNTKQKDSLIDKMCLDLKRNTHLNDSTRLKEIYKNHLYPFLENYEKKNIDSIWTSIYYRFQRNCSDFLKILDGLEENKSDWKELEKGYKPKSKLKWKKCKSIQNLNELYYLEYNGDKVIVNLNNGIWTEKFVDGTYSKLNFKWNKNCSFQLTFIRSNNETRKNFSNKGDIYVYELIEEKNGIYTIITPIKKENKYLEFKLYTK